MKSRKSAPLGRLRMIGFARTWPAKAAADDERVDGSVVDRFRVAAGQVWRFSDGPQHQTIEGHRAPERAGLVRQNLREHGFAGLHIEGRVEARVCGALPCSDAEEGLAAAGA